jgi:CheY-like chemotaxis protein
MAHILLIEDDDQYRDMLASMLRQDGHQVMAAADGTQGLRLCQEHVPDLVITDILMPDTDGIEVIMELSRWQHAPPVIAISGGRRSISAQFNLQSAAMVGVRATLAKPFAREELRQAISLVLA